MISVTEFDKWPSFKPQRAHVDNATAIVAAPGAGLKVVVLAFQGQGASVFILQETGATPINFTAINGIAATSVMNHNPNGWFETRDNRGLQSTAAFSGVCLYKVVPA